MLTIHDIFRRTVRTPGQDEYEVEHNRAWGRNETTDVESR
jgi:hypothetical protein